MTLAFLFTVVLSLLSGFAAGFLLFGRQARWRGGRLDPNILPFLQGALKRTGSARVRVLVRVAKALDRIGEVSNEPND